MAGSGWWDGGISPWPPRILRRSSARPPPPSRLSHGLREAGLGFFGDQIVPAWAGQTRPLGYHTAQKPPMNFFFLCWRCTSQNGMSKPTPISHGSLPESGNWDPQFFSPLSPGLWGAGCSWDWLSSEWGTRTLSRAGSAPRSKIFPEPPSLEFQCSQSPFILHPNISRAPTFPEPPSSCIPCNELTQSQLPGCQPQSPTICQDPSRLALHPSDWKTGMGTSLHCWCQHRDRFRNPGAEKQLWHLLLGKKASKGDGNAGQGCRSRSTPEKWAAPGSRLCPTEITHSVSPSPGGSEECEERECHILRHPVTHVPLPVPLSPQSSRFPAWLWPAWPRGVFVDHQREQAWQQDR